MRKTLLICSKAAKNWLAHPFLAVGLLAGAFAAEWALSPRGISETWFKIVLSGIVLAAIGLIQGDLGRGFLLRAGALLSALGILIGSRFALDAEFIVREGEMTHHLRLERGEAPAGWKPFDAGTSEPAARGYWDPGFAIVFEKPTDFPVGAPERAVLKTVPEKESGRAAGLKIAPEAFENSGESAVDLFVQDLESDGEFALPEMRVGDRRAFDGGTVRLDYVENRGEKAGYALKLSYEAKGEGTREFWVFTEFPEFDGANRKGSRHFFRAAEVRPVLQLRGRVKSEPGRYLWIAGFAVMLAGLGMWLAPGMRNVIRRVERWKAA